MTRSGEALEHRGHDVDYLLREELHPERASPAYRRLAIPALIPWVVRRRAQSGTRYDVVELDEYVAAVYCFLRTRLPGAGLPPCVVISYAARGPYWIAQRERWTLTGTRGPLKTRVVYPPTVLWPSRYSLKRADAAAVVSPTDEAFLKAELGMPAERVIPAYPGVDASFFEGEADHHRQDGEVRMAYVASLVPPSGDRKGVRELAEAWRTLAPRYPQLRLTLMATVLSEAESLQHFDAARERITVIPLLSTEELRHQLLAHDIYVLPSWFEGTPLATLQGAAAGLPCVVGGVGGHGGVFRQPDPSQDGGVLVKPHNGRALAEALEPLILDADLRRRLGARARQRARSFTWESTARQLELAYAAAIDHAPAR